MLQVHWPGPLSCLAGQDTFCIVPCHLPCPLPSALPAARRLVPAKRAVAPGNPSQQRVPCTYSLVSEGSTTRYGSSPHPAQPESSLRATDGPVSLGVCSVCNCQST